MITRTSHYSRKALLLAASLLVWGVTGDASASACQAHEGIVLRAMFTTRLENREPVDHVLIIDNRTRELHFFTDLSQLQGHTITHRWEFEGRVVHTKSFEVKGQRWRAASRKDLDPAMVGRWTAIVVDENDCPLKAVVFQYVQHSGQQLNAILPPE